MLKLTETGNSLTAEQENALVTTPLAEHRLTSLRGFVKPQEIDKLSNRVSQIDLSWLLNAHPEAIPLRVILRALQELPQEEEPKKRGETAAGTYRQAA